MEEEDLEAREKQLRTARLMLWAALIGGLITIFAMVTNSAGLFITFMLLSWLGGLSGVRDVARAIGTHPLLMYPVLVVACVPIVNLLPILYYLIRAHAALGPGGAPEEPVSAALPLRKAAAGSAAPQPRAATGIRAAIACVKSADLGSGAASASGDETLTVSVPSIPDMPAEDLPVTRAVQGVFLVCYMVDEGTHYSYVNEGQLQAAGMTRDALHGIGMANLAALVDGKPGLQLHPQEGFQGLVMGGQFEASLLLVDALWDRALAKHFPNGPVVAIPSRDVCAFCDSQSARGIAQLRKVVARVTAGGSRLMSDKLFIRRDGAWRKLAS
jgi:hypothetical protein